MKKMIVGSAVLLALGGCATTPTGPSVLVLPGTGKSFDQFNRDEVFCKDYAMRGLSGKTPASAGIDSTVASSVAGTAIGAVAGAAIGGREGAAVGAGTGLLFGSVAGSETGRYERSNTQTRYDHSYIQCMYSAGHRVPVSAGMFTNEVRPAGPSTAIPPPPAGIPPAPPPGVK
jgi:hypothetical protein